MRTGDDFAQVEEKLSERESEAILVMINPDASKISGCTESATEIHIKNWLKYASDKAGGHKKRADKQKEKERELKAKKTGTVPADGHF
ncbi:uncharacterized protein LOC124272206 isoform X3 [Haliotis rubra]|uniref:uncharacterized protein LOC124272206 isoform X3 n=1 Tax=Haliotis rubra TaxID=36100 RepID=UPI001EE5AC61|nr:uncharacterized protein LOC124272206 isoform X3 [Haliotis rubra]